MPKSWPAVNIVVEKFHFALKEARSSKNKPPGYRAHKVRQHARPEKVAQARRLFQQRGYPSPDIVAKVAARLAGILQSRAKRVSF